MNGKPDSVGTSLIKFGATLTGMMILLPFAILGVVILGYILVNGGWMIFPLGVLSFIIFSALRKSST